MHSTKDSSNGSNVLKVRAHRSHDKVSNPAVREEQADRVKSEMSEMPENKASPPLSSGVVGALAASAQVAALLQGGGTTTGVNSSRVSSPRGSAAPSSDVRLTLSEDQGLGRRIPAPGTWTMRLQNSLEHRVLYRTLGVATGPGVCVQYFQQFLSWAEIHSRVCRRTQCPDPRPLQYRRNSARHKIFH